MKGNNNSEAKGSNYEESLYAEGKFDFYPELWGRQRKFKIGK